MPESPEVQIPKQIEQAIDGMPSISPVFNKLKAMAQDMNTGAGEMVKVIMTDPVLSAKVIKLVNSAFYGLKSPINSLAEAVLFLGVNTVKNLAMSTAVMEKILLDKKEKDISIDPREFWRHCLGTAVATRMLAKVKGVAMADLEAYFLGGLLHDLGKVVFIQAAPKIYQKALDDTKEKSQILFEAEMFRFGCSHTHVGALLARKWRLEPHMIETIERHHDPTAIASDNQILRLVMLANNLCKQSKLGEAGDTLTESWLEDLTGKLALDPVSIEPVMQQLPTELQKAAEFLGIVQGMK
jgi:putative nucleotidyltransferase with HDIG domain